MTVTVTFYENRVGSAIGTLAVAWYRTDTGPSLSSNIVTYAGSTGIWQQQTVNLTAFEGQTGHIVWQYYSGSTNLGNLAMDQVVVTTEVAGQTYTFEVTTEGLTTSTSGPTTVAGAYSERTALAVGTTARRWNLRTGGQTVAGTGPTAATVGSYYVYAETNGATLSNFWMFSPQITLVPNPWVTPGSTSSFAGRVRDLDTPLSLRLNANTALFTGASYALSSGSLPPGLTLSSNGTITGSVAAASVNEGYTRYDFGVTATGSSGSNTKSMYIETLEPMTSASIETVGPTVSANSFSSPSQVSVSTIDTGSAQTLKPTSGGLVPYSAKLAKETPVIVSP